jgi:hypothetical protein
MISFVSHIPVDQERRSLYKASVIRYKTHGECDLFGVDVIQKDLPRMEVLMICPRGRWHPSTTTTTALYDARVDFSCPDALPTLELKLYPDDCVDNGVNNMISPPDEIWPVSEFRLISLSIEHEDELGEEGASLYDQSLEKWAEYVANSFRFDCGESQAHLTEFSDFDSIFQHLEVFVLGSANISYDMLHQILDAARRIKQLIVLVERGSDDQRRLLIDRLDDSNTLVDLGLFFSEAVFDDLSYDPATGIPIPAFPKAYRRQLRTLRCFVDPYAIAWEHQDVHNRGRCPGLRLSNVQHPAPLFTLELYLKYQVALPNPEAFACALRQHLPRGIYVKIIAADELIQRSKQLGQEVVVRLHEGSDKRGAFIQWTNDLLPQPYIAPKRGMTADEGRSDPLGEETTRGEADGCWLQ